jgi:hypothetical protein
MVVWLGILLIMIRWGEERKKERESNWTLAVLGNLKK